MTKESYPFPIYSGILDPSHYKQIGTAIWLFLWCISSTTKEITKDGIKWGMVYGGAPVKLGDIAESFAIDERTIKRWIKTLEDGRYIATKRAPYGLIIAVRNSKKRSDKKVPSREDNNVPSVTDRTEMSLPDRTDLSKREDTFVPSNKDITRDIIFTTNTTNKDSVDIIAERFIDLKTALIGKESYPTAKDYEAIARIVTRGMPLPQTIELLEKCFEEYKEKNPRGKIYSFGYCENYLNDKFDAILAKEKAKQKIDQTKGDELIEHPESDRAFADVKLYR